MTAPEICRCGHPRRDHTERYVPGPGGGRGCPLPCECVEFVLRAAPATVYTAPLGEVDPGIANAMRAFGPGTTDGGRAEAGWFEAGTIDREGLQFTPRNTPGPE